MSPINPFSGYGGAFDPQMAAAMAMVVEQVCQALSINGDAAAREAIAIRIVELVRQGEHDLSAQEDVKIGSATSWPAPQENAPMTRNILRIPVFVRWGDVRAGQLLWLWC
jgi:hypothetical protein